MHVWARVSNDGECTIERERGAVYSIAESVGIDTLVG